MKKIIGLLICILIFPMANAVLFGVSDWESKPIKMYPGMTKEIKLAMQNQEEEDLTIAIEITDGEEIASVVDAQGEYIVKAKENDVMVFVELSIPEETLIGTEYTVDVSFKQIVGAEEEGMVQLAQGSTKRFPVVIMTEEEILGGPAPVEKSYTGIIVLGILLLLIIVAFIIWKKKK